MGRSTTLTSLHASVNSVYTNNPGHGSMAANDVTSFLPYLSLRIIADKHLVVSSRQLDV